MLCCGCLILWWSGPYEQENMVAGRTTMLVPDKRLNCLGKQASWLSVLPVPTGLETVTYSQFI